ncbi:hypothetical protein KXD93_27915 [Mucilaginibacter sp. BJC16-A38]|uniref:hypothetical protein n=1 Tax=Mucilaginibacter phenanthrenivorans TaxID=1234842 RepID=UPI0021579EC7|nr:hypothetical protein [Mucilaginibacter phenanthrenivorans]MCR8561513.1 hypothetical protein [Mucilaginibacter phenanthrenivorans]
MKKVYLYLLLGIIAIIIMTLIVFNYDPKTETWGSMLIGALFGFLFYRMIKNRRQKSAK